MEIFTSQNLIALLTLTALEIVLGIDNVIFIAILTGKLPENQRAMGRQLGIGLAVGTRIVLLLFISWIMGLTETWITIFGNEISGRDLILLVGGLFLIAKSTYEIHDKLETVDHKQHDLEAVKKVALSGVIFQVILVDIVFSLDSVITAVGIADELWVMIVAIVVAAGIMLAAAGAISAFVEQHPTMKVLALSFLILIGVMLVIEGWSTELAHDLHLRNYIYFSMFFAFLVEMLNIRLRRQPVEPVELRNQAHIPPKESGD
jgi:predicted tellurium resistance membrane protein TerC